MELTVKAKSCTWQGRRVYRSYYLQNGTWRRYGRWEHATAEGLKSLVNASVTFSNVKLTWKD
jgi:hypothetical protein